MKKSREITCDHCGIVYKYPSDESDELSHPKKFNDSKYCPLCKSAIIDALVRVPKKVEIINEETTEVNVPQILRWINADRSTTIISVMEDDSEIVTKTVKGQGPFFGRTYVLEYRNDLSNSTIYVMKLKSLITGEVTGYYNNY